MLGAFSLRDLAFIAQGKSIIDILISSAIQNYNLFTVANSNPNYIAGSTRINVNVTANVGSTTAGGHAFAVPAAFTAGDEIFITNSATIITKGGNGGNGANGIQWSGATSGETIPGAAINAEYPVSITNNGTFAGGGGGGGAGATFIGNPRRGGDGGGGGAGFTAGSAGIGGPPGPYAPGFPTSSGISGSSGTLTSGGAGGGVAGAGGGQGADGSNGTAVSNPGTPGGTRGYYATGNPNITWVVAGTRLGRVQ